jgi:glutamine synthetase
MKDTKDRMSLFSQIREAAASKDYELLSELQIEMGSLMSELREAYNVYKRNIID